MVALSLDGSSMSPQAIAEALVRVKSNKSNNSHEDELILREVDLDADQVALVVDVIRSRYSSSTSNATWKSIHLVHCSGMVNDAIMACMSAPNMPNVVLQQSVISPQTTYCLTYGLKYNKGLRSLKLSIPMDASVSRNLSTALARNFTLEELSLENSTHFDEPGVVMNLSFGLRLNQHLKSLTLDGCYLQDEQVSSIMLALDGHSSLERLSLKRNSCHYKGMSAVATLLHANKLKELDLSFLVRPTKEQREQYQQEGEEEEQKKEEEIQKEETKKETKAEENKDNAELIETEEDDTKPAAKDDNEDEKPKDDICDEEKEEDNHVRNTSLCALWLSGNGVGDDYLESVMNVFGKGSQLETLSLFGNRISSAGVQRILLKKLPYLKQMKKLYLGNNTFFKPAHLRDELIHATQKNYFMEEFVVKDLLETDSDTVAIQELLTHYCRMNVYGRRIMASFEERQENRKAIPLGLWPVVLQRANRMHERGETWNDNSESSNEKSDSYAPDAIFCLLHGPVLYENHDLVPQG